MGKMYTKKQTDGHGPRREHTEKKQTDGHRPRREYAEKKQTDGHGPRREYMDKQENEMDIRTIMKDVETFSYSHMSWKERKKFEDRKVVSLGGKPQKNQRLPLSVARPMMKKQKQREEKMLQERMILGRFGGKIGGSSKKTVGKHKAEDRGLKLSEGRFKNGILDVKHLLKTTPHGGINMSNAGKRNGGGNWKHDKKGAPASKKRH